MKLMFAAVSIAFLAGCATTGSDSTSDPLRATVGMTPTKGSKTIGEVTFEEVSGGVMVFANVKGLKPGQQHGFHIHEAGDCSSGDGMSAKGHFNPTGKSHGAPGSGHAGDLPSLVGDKAGHGKLNVKVTGLTVGPGPTSVVGRGLIIHADPDDFKTQPTGNAGARLACGVIQKE